MFKHPTMGDIIIIIQHIFVVGIYTEGNISFTIGGSQSKFFTFRSTARAILGQILRIATWGTRTTQR